MIERPQVYQEMYNRIDHNQNLLIAVTGGTGSGKTYLSTRLGEIMSKDRGVPFSADNFCLSVKELLRLVVHGNLPTGSVLIMDESGISMNARDWQSRNNKLVQFLLQTFRHRNLVTIFVAPDLSFVDLGSRRLLHWWIETYNMDRKRRICWAKPKMIRVNQQDGKFRFLFPREQQGIMLNSRPIRRIGFRMPTKKLREAVDEKINTYKTMMAEEWLRELEQDESKKKSRNAMTEMQAKCLFLNQELGCNGPMSAEVLGITPQSVGAHWQALRKKGYKIKENISTPTEYDKEKLAQLMEEDFSDWNNLFSV